MLILNSPAEKGPYRPMSWIGRNGGGGKKEREREHVLALPPSYTSPQLPGQVQSDGFFPSSHKYTNRIAGEKRRSSFRRKI